MCTHQTNQQKLLWYLKDNGTIPCLDIEFHRIRSSTNLSKEEVLDFYELLKKGQKENTELQTTMQKSNETEVIEYEEEEKEEEDDIPELD